VSVAAIPLSVAALADGGTSGGEPAAAPTIAWGAESGQARIANGRLELFVETGPGLNARSLRDLKGGAVSSDRDYCWPGGGFPVLEHACCRFAAGESRAAASGGFGRKSFAHRWKRRKPVSRRAQLARGIRVGFRRRDPTSRTAHLH